MYLCLEAGVKVDQEGVAFCVGRSEDPLLRHETVYLIPTDDVRLLQYLQHQKSLIVTAVTAD